MTYPADENAIVAVQQVFGNLFSAMLVPLSNRVKHLHIAAFNIRTDYFMLLSICGGGGLYFCTFTAPLRRLLAETAESNRAAAENGTSKEMASLLGDNGKELDNGDAEIQLSSMRSSGNSRMVSPRVRG